MARNPGSGPDHSETGVHGDPTEATETKGRAALDAMAIDLIEGLRALYPDAHPTPGRRLPEILKV